MQKNVKEVTTLLNELGIVVTKDEKTVKTTIKELDGDGLEILHKIKPISRKILVKRSGTGLTVIVKC